MAKKKGLPSGGRDDSFHLSYGFQWIVCDAEGEGVDDSIEGRVLKGQAPHISRQKSEGL